MLHLVFALMAATSAPGAAHQHGVDLYKQHKYSEAIAILEDAVKSEKPDSPEYKESALLIGQSYFMLSQAPESDSLARQIAERQ